MNPVVRGHHEAGIVSNLATSPHALGRHQWWQPVVVAMAARQRVVVDAAARQREQRGRCPTADVPRLGTALRRMATADDHAAAAALLESCGTIMVNDAAEDGSTVLHNAVRAGATEVVALLLGRGADLGAMNVQQRRPLQIAVMARQSQAAKLLLEWLADVAAQDVVGGSALHNAVAGANTELTALLLKHGAPASATDLNGGTALHVAASCWHSQSSRSAGAACVPSIRLLLSRRASVTAVDHYGRTPLHDASESASLEATRLLLHAGADASAASRTGLTPANLAVEQVVQHYGGYLAQAGEQKLLSVRKLLRQLQGKLERGGGAEDGPALTDAQAHNGLAWVLGAPHLPFDFRAYLESNGVGDAVMVAQLLLGQSRATPEAQTERWMLPLRVLLCELEPGEMLFIPSIGHRHGGGWWHGTCNLDAWSAGFTTFHTPAPAVLSPAQG